MSTTAIPDRFTTLPDERALQATVVALEEHGFSVEVACPHAAGIKLTELADIRRMRRRPGGRLPVIRSRGAP